MAAATVAAWPAPATASASPACAAGEDIDTYTGTCVPYLVPSSPTSSNLCPAGVSGTECSSAQAPAAAAPPVAQQQPEQSLKDVSTPDY
jgi:hypothetical protein